MMQNDQPQKANPIITPSTDTSPKVAAAAIPQAASVNGPLTSYQVPQAKVIFNQPPDQLLENGAFKEEAQPGAVAQIEVPYRRIWLSVGASFVALLLIAGGVSYWGGKHNAQGNNSKLGSINTQDVNNTLQYSLNSADLKINRNTIISNGKTFSVYGNVAIQNEANSSNAFSIQNAKGNNLFIADTVNNRVGIGETPTGTAALQVGGDLSVKGRIISADGNVSVGNDGIRIGSVLVCTARGCISSSSPAPTPASPTIDVANVAYLNKDQTFSGSLNFSGSVNTASLKVNGVSGTSISCAANEYIKNPTVSSGVITGGVCNPGPGVAVATIQEVYNASTPADFTLNSSNGLFGIRDGVSPLATNLFEVSDNSGANKYFAVSSAGVSVLGNANVTGQYQVNGTQISSANLSNDSNLAKVNGNTTFTGNNTFSSASNSFTGNGAGLSSVNAATLGGQAGSYYTNATNISSGTLSDSRLSGNVALLNGSGPQTFSGNNKFTGTILAQNAANSTNAFQIQNTAGTSNLFVADTTNSRVAINQASAAYPLDVAGDINSTTGIRVGGTLICSSGGCVAASGSGSYIQNGTTTQTANLNIRSNAAGSVAGVFEGASGQSADILDVQNFGGGTKYFAVSSSGVAVNGNVNTTGQYQVSGTQISSANLSNDSNLAKVNGNTTFTGNNTFSSASNSFTGNGSGLSSVDAATLGGQASSYYTNATNISSGTLSDSRLSGNVALLNGTQSFTGANTFTGTVLSQNATNSTSAFQIQNSLGTSNLFVADTVNTRIAIGQAAANYPLDVAGDINSTTGIRVGGTLLCSSGGCLAASGSGSYIQNGTTTQTGNFNVRSNAAGSVAGVVEGANGQSVDIFDVQGFGGGTKYLAVGTSGASVSGNINATGQYQVSGTQISSANLSNDANLAKVDGNTTFTGNNTFSSASNSFTGNGSGLSSLNGSNVSSGTVADARLSSNVALLNANQSFTGNNTFTGTVLSKNTVNATHALEVQNASGVDILNVDTSANQVIVQSPTNATDAFQVRDSVGSPVLSVDTVNRRIGIGGSSTATLYLRDGMGGGSDLLQVDSTVTGSNKTVFKVDQHGSTIFQNDTNSAAAFQVQNAAGTSNLFIADTTSSRIAIGQATASYTLDVGGDINTTGTYRVNGTQISSANLSNDANLAKLNANQTFTGNNTFTGTVLAKNTADSTAAFQVQNSAGTNLFKVDTSNTAITLNGNTTIGAGYYIAITGSGTRPSSPAAGTLYYDTTTNQLIQFNGTKWVGDRTTATKIVAASNSSQAEKDAADYVASGTGDQATINTALTAAAGGTVYLMKGTYSISASISVPNNTTLSGAGAGTTITIPNAQNGSYNMIANTDTTTGTNVTVRDLLLDGNKANQTSGHMIGIYFNHVGSGSTRTGGKVIGNTIQNLYGTWNFTSGINTEISSGNLIENNNIFNNAGNGIDSGSSSGDSIIGNTLRGNVNGILINTSDNDTVTGNTLSANTTNGIYGLNATKNTISNNTLQGNSSYGINLETSSNLNTISGNIVQGSGNYGVRIYSSNNNSILGNNVQGNSWGGIDLDTSNDNAVSTNKIHDNGGSTSNEGIVLFTATKNSVTGNDITDNATAGSSCTSSCLAIDIINASSTGNYLASNHFLGDGTHAASLNDATSGGNTYSNQPLTESGDASFRNATNSTTAFQIQNAAGTSNLFIANTTNSRIAINQATASYTLDVAGDINTTGVYRISGTQISSANLSNDANLAKLNANQTFTGNNTFTGTVLDKNTADSTAAFQVQNSSGQNLLAVDTSNSKIQLANINTSTLGGWTLAANLPAAPRDSSAVVQANGYIYQIGGGNPGPSNTVYYSKLNADGSLGTWTSSASVLPQNLYYHTAVALNGYVYVIGGYNGTTAQSTVYYAKLSPDGSVGSWQTSSNPLPQVRYEHASFAANGYIYVIGGDNGSTSQSTVYYAKANSDGSTGAWATNVNGVPQIVKWESVQVANGYAYILGGYNGSDLTTVYYGKLNLDGSINAWSTNVNSLPQGTETHSSAVINGYIYTFGVGNGGSCIGSNTYFAKLNADGSTGIWQNGISLPQNLCGSATIANGYVYVGGVYSGAGAQKAFYYASVARVQLGASLDLVGLTGQTLADLGSGGSVTAGNITAVGNLQVQGASSLAGNLALAGNMSVQGDATINGNNGLKVKTASTSTSTSLSIDQEGSNDGIYVYNGNSGSSANGITIETYSTGAGIQIFNHGSGNYLTLGTKLTVSSTGIATFKNSTDTTAAFQIQNAAGTSLLTADTSNTAISLAANTTVGAGYSLTMVGGATGTRPASPTKGTLYFDTTTNQLIQYNGSKWVDDRSTATKIVAASNSTQAEKDAADYVASGTGDQTTINSALTAAAAGAVYLMEGTYTLSAPISVPNNTTLTGAGAGTIITIPNAFNAALNMITNTDTSTGTNVAIRNLVLDGNKANQTAGAQVGINFNNMGGGSGTSAREGGKIASVVVKNMRSDGIDLNNSHNNTVTASTLQNEGSDGIYVAGNLNTLTGNVAQGNYNGFDIGNDNNTVTGNTAEGNSQYGIYVNANYNTVTGNTTKGNASEGINLGGGHNTVTGNTATSNLYGIESDSSGNIISSNSVTNNTNLGILIYGPYNSVSANTVQSNGAQGIWVGDAYNTITGNDIYSSATYGIYLSGASGNTVSSNKVHSSSGAADNNGIYVDGSSSKNSITANDITDASCTTTCYAININSGTATGNYLASNHILGDGTNPATIHDIATGNTYSNQPLTEKGDASFKNATNSTTTFQVQNAAGAKLLNVDSINGTTTAQGTNTAATLGAELATGVTCSGTNWAGSGAGPYTHTAGLTTALTCTPPASVTSGVTYQIRFSVGGTINQGDTVYACIGNSCNDYIRTTGSYQEVSTANNTNGLTFNPSSNFIGTVTATSVKQITQSSSILSVNNSDNSVGIELRTGGSGAQGVYIGQGSGQFSYGAGGSVGVGYQALQKDYGGLNTATGYQALQYNVYGLENVANGYQALQINDSGSQNVAMGAYALDANATGSYNVGIGWQATGGNTAGNGNTGVGFDALNGNVYGSYNTAIGYYAGQVDPTVGQFQTLNNLQNATMLGYGAEAQASNVLILGGAGSNAVNVGIGTTAPSNLFSISPDFYDTGTASVTIGTAAVTGAGTAWTSNMAGMEFIFADGTKYTVASVASATSLTLSSNATVTESAKAYRIHNPAFYVSSTGKTSIRTSTDSTAAFQVQNSSGQSLFKVDTTNSNITLNGLNPGNLQAWQTSPNTLPATRYDGGAVIANGYAYFVGGSDNTPFPTTTVYYSKLNADGTIGAWTTSANPLPQVRELGVTVVANGYIYYIGGDAGGSALTTTYYSKLNADGSNSAWQTSSNNLPVGRNYTAGVVANGYVYIFGGGNNTTYYSKLNADGSNSAWQLSAVTFPATVADATATVVSGYAYVIGGYNAGSSSTVYYSKLNADGTIGAWTTSSAPLPSGRDFASATSLNGYIYVMGGNNGTAQTSVYYAKVNANGSTSAWTNNTNLLPNGIQDAGIASANGYIYIIGGYNGALGNAQNTVFYASTPRIQLGSSIDLIGLGAGNLADIGAAGGSITAANITAVGNLQVQGAANFVQGASVMGNFNVSSSSGTVLLAADPVNMTITLGAPSATPVLLVLGNKNTSGDPTCTNGAIYYNSNSNQFRFCQNGSWTGLGSSYTAPAYVTSLPGSPADGQEIYYKADATNGIIWHLRYNSTSTYWEYLGGGALEAEYDSDTTQTMTSGVWATLTNGPSVSVPLDGDYEVSFGGLSGFDSGTWGSTALGIGWNGSAPSGLGYSTYTTYGNSLSGQLRSTQERTRRITGVTHTSPLQIWAYASGSGTPSVTYGYRFIVVTPVRVH